MGGIFCATARDDVVPSIMEGLAALSRRGCDSAGLGALAERKIQRRRAAGPLSSLEVLLADEPIVATTVIGQSRWATHGEPSRRNAQPHASARVAVVHTGVVENHAELRAELEREGVQFRSDTDSEVIVWLLDRELAHRARPMAALRNVVPKLQGDFAIGAICTQQDDRVYGACRGIPLTAGRSAAGSWLSSDAAAVSPFAAETVPIEDGQIAELSPGRVRIFDSHLEQRTPRWTRSEPPSDPRESGKVITNTVQQEIMVQPAVLEHTLRHLRADIASGELEGWCGPLWRATRILAVGADTSFYAAQAATGWFERIAGAPVDLELSSELEVRKPIMARGTIALLLSHSADDADTLGALRYLKQHDVPTVALVAEASSPIAQEADVVLDCRAGTGVGISSTKAFISQLGALAAAAVAIRRIRDGNQAGAPPSLFDIPRTMNAALGLEDQFASLGRRIAEAGRGVFVGRGFSHPLAFFGARQLESLAELHAEAMAGGELKHRSSMLMEPGTPVVLLAPHDETLRETLTDARDVAAAGGEAVLLCDSQSAVMAMNDDLSFVDVGPIDSVWSPLVLGIAVQLIAYHAARARDWQLERPQEPGKGAIAG